MRTRGGQDTVLDILDQNAARHPSTVAVVDGDVRLTWSEYWRAARAIALLLLDLGVCRGEVIGLQMVNRAEHPLVDLGALIAGAIPSSYYNAMPEEQLVYVAADSAASVVVVDAEQLPRWLAICPRLPNLRQILVLDLDPDEQLPPGVLRFEECVERTLASLDERADEVDEARGSVRPDDPLTIVYTSGTTGPPKGVVLTHDALAWTVAELNRQMVEYLGEPVPVGWSVVSYLPLAHVAERTFSYYNALAHVQTVHYVRDVADLPNALTTTRPYLFFAVPRVWERIHNVVRERVAGAPSPVRRLLGRTAISVAQRTGAQRWGGPDAGLKARVLHPIMERLVYRNLRVALGLDRVVIAMNGAAQMGAEAATFFVGIGVPLGEIYGMTETAGVLTISRPGTPRLGSVGRPVTGLELKIDADGEIVVRGPNVTPGYLNRPDADADAFDGAGWLHTGDLGQLDDDGYLWITGRKKDLINTATGNTVSPGNVELTLSAGSSLIGSVYVHGDDKPCLVALVALDAASWREWCAARRIEVGSTAEAVRHGRVRLEIAQAIGAGNARLSGAERVRNWALVEELWTVQTGELTPTMKLKRAVIAARYREELNSLYDPETTRAAWAEAEF